MDYGHWLCEEFDPDEYFGFVYVIIDTTNDRRYIGKKQQPKLLINGSNSISHSIQQ